MSSKRGDGIVSSERNFAWALVVIAACAGLGAAGYFVGHAGGVDVHDAEARARVLGAARGVASGRQRGYRGGYATAWRASYRLTYGRTYRATYAPAYRKGYNAASFSSGATGASQPNSSASLAGRPCHIQTAAYPNPAPPGYRCEVVPGFNTAGELVPTG